MPLYMVFLKATCVSRRRTIRKNVMSCIQDIKGENTVENPPIEEQLQLSFTENKRTIPERYFESLPASIQKLFTKDNRVVKEIYLGNRYWEENSAICLVRFRSNKYFKLCGKMSFTRTGKKWAKNCLITVGATAPFPELIHAALQPESLAKFQEQGFTRITFQCGDSEMDFHELAPKDAESPELQAFGFKKEGLHKDIFACKEVKGSSKEGLVISHAGAGTILDVMRMGVPLIVVPNPSLLDNHQEELAIELERQGYVTHCDYKGLAEAIEKAGKLERKAWGGQNTTGGIVRVANEILGYEEDTSARLD